MRAILVAGLGFGDEGKGTIVDFLTRQRCANLVVRFNGAGQAAHNVITSNGLHHCFSQFGSGSLAGAKTHLSQFMSVEPLALIKEAEHLQTIGMSNPFDRLTIDPRAPILTPYHRALNQIRELSRSVKHGTCGYGAGELGRDLAEGLDVLTADLLYHGFQTARRLAQIRERLYAEARKLSDTMPDEISKLFNIDHSRWISDARRAPVRIGNMPENDIAIFEGAQGVLLDEWKGFHPHTTWSNTTFDNAYEILNEKYGGSGMRFDVETIGVTRAYATRHGAGPFPTEDASMSVPNTEHNTLGDWQGAFRIGSLDLMLLDYAVRAIGGVDSLAVTCLDHVHGGSVCVDYATPFGLTWILNSVATAHRNLTRQEQVGAMLKFAKPRYAVTRDNVELLSLIETRLKTNISIVSSGPTAEDKVSLECKE